MDAIQQLPPAHSTSRDEKMVRSWEVSLSPGSKLPSEIFAEAFQHHGGDMCRTSKRQREGCEEESDKKRLKTEAHLLEDSTSSPPLLPQSQKRTKNTLKLSLSADTLAQRAHQGDAEAQFQLGQAYALGQDVEQSSSLAVYWLTLSAKTGHSKAQYVLGKVYARGVRKTVQQDSTRAIFWWKEAAKQGHSRAQSRISEMNDYTHE